MENGKIFWTIGFVIVISISIFLLYSIVTHFFIYDKECLEDEAQSYCVDGGDVKRHFFIGKPYFICSNNETNEYHSSQLKECG